MYFVSSVNYFSLGVFRDGTTVITTSDDGKSKVFDLAKIIAEK